MGSEIGVDPRGIGVKAVHDRRREPFQRCFGKPVDAKDTHPPVERQRRGPDDLRQASGADPPHELHLKKAILGMHITQGEIGVPLALGRNARNSVAVADDRHRCTEPGNRDRSLGLRPRRLDQKIGTAHNYQNKNSKPDRDPPQP